MNASHFTVWSLIKSSPDPQIVTSTSVRTPIPRKKYETERERIARDMCLGCNKKCDFGVQRFEKCLTDHGYKGRKKK